MCPGCDSHPALPPGINRTPGNLLEGSKHKDLDLLFGDSDNKNVTVLHKQVAPPPGSPSENKSLWSQQAGTISSHLFPTVPVPVLSYRW